MEVNTFDIRIEKASVSKINEVDFSNIGFGTVYSDHMFVADYEDGEWKDARIVPFGDMSLSPSTLALHYGQAIFEGLKAYKDPNGNPQVFRPEKNFARFNRSARRIAMPEVPEELFMSGMRELISLDSNWIPTIEGSSLYIRPFLFASGTTLGVKASDKYRFMIITCPVNAYYTKPVKVVVADKYVRAAPGGVGFAKVAGNYAATLQPAIEAQQQGYDQILWTDAIEFKYIRESGTMNVFFAIDDVVITPSLESETILEGVTRDSIIQLLRDKGTKVEEREISIDEVIEAHKNGKLQDAFGAGTAAVITFISHIGYKGRDYELPPVETRKFSPAIKKELEDIQRGVLPDPHGWLLKV